jgi:sulfate adenylyltransferase
MKTASLVEPHGGKPVNLLVDESRAALLKEIALSLPDISLNDRQLCDLELLATGAFSPLLEIGNRPVTLLDGDIVRRNLSSELSFSKEHRDINVRRIGFVASEITKNRGIAICAPIAPYESTRAEIRKVIEEYGGFIEAHVATPIEECEKRDRKGMYAKARAGLIKGFTGVNDPYEIPESPEVRIDTTDLTPDEAVQEILLFLGQKGFI